MKIISKLTEGTSLIVTAISVYLSIPALGIDPSVASRQFAHLSLPLIAMMYFPLQCVVAYGFGLLFRMSNHIGEGIFRNPLSFVLCTFLSLLSAWVTFFCVFAVIVANSYSKTSVAVLFGSVSAAIAVTTLYLHLKDTLDRSRLIGSLALQGGAFLIMYFVYTLD